MMGAGKRASVSVPPSQDTGAAHVARRHNYWLGGKMRPGPRPVGAGLSRDRRSGLDAWSLMPRPRHDAIFCSGTDWRACRSPDLLVIDSARLDLGQTGVGVPRQCL